MSTFQWFVGISLAVAAAGMLGIVSALDRANYHLRNIADRLLDIENLLRKRP